MSSTTFKCDGEEYKISPSFNNLLEELKSHTDIQKSDKRGYRSLNREGKIILYNYIIKKYNIPLSSLMDLDYQFYIKYKCYTLFKSNHELKLVRKLRKLDII